MFFLSRIGGAKSVWLRKVNLEMFFHGSRAAGSLLNIPLYRVFFLPNVERFFNNVVTDKF